MPKQNLDYSNTIIYKIICKDTDITDTYVGHTIDFVQRKCGHMQSCINSKSANYNCKLYEVIRANGGWDNWRMDIINFYNCKNKSEARQKEQEHFIELNANLNSIEPFQKQKDLIKKSNLQKKDKELLYCYTCKIKFTNKNTMEIHNTTNKHKKKQESNASSCDNMNDDTLAFTFNCEQCKFSCIRKPDWTRHLSTSKHKNMISGDNTLIKIIPKYTCNICCKEYKSNVGLWKHKKICKGQFVVNISDKFTGNQEEDFNIKVNMLLKNNEEIKEIVSNILKTNNELIKQMKDLK